MACASGESCILTTMLFLTGLFFLVEIIVGYITNSLTLVADSYHMLSDVVALSVGLASVKASKMKSKRNTYGWQRAEVLGALVNSVFLIALCFSIVVDSLKRFSEPEEIENPVMMMTVGGVGLLINVLGLLLFKCHAHSHGGGAHGHSHFGGHGHSHGATSPGHSHSQGHGHSHTIGKTCHSHSLKHDSDATHKLTYEQNGVQPFPIIDDTVTDEDSFIPFSSNDSDSTNNNKCVNLNNLQEREVYNIHDNIEIEINKKSSSASLNMQGVFLHIMGDALGSVAVIVSGAVIWQVEDDWKYYLDPALGIVLAIIIFFGTVKLFRKTAWILLQTVPEEVCMDTICEELLEIEGIKGIHECHVWQLSGGKIIASIHVHCKDLTNYMRRATDVKKVFHRGGVHSTTVQIEIDESQDGSNLVCSLKCPTSGGQNCHEFTCCSDT